MLSCFPRGVLDEILNLIESVSEGFPSYTCYYAKADFNIRSFHMFEGPLPCDKASYYGYLSPHFIFKAGRN